MICIPNGSPQCEPTGTDTTGQAGSLGASTHERSARRSSTRSPRISSSVSPSGGATIGAAGVRTASSPAITLANSSISRRRDCWATRYAEAGSKRPASSRRRTGSLYRSRSRSNHGACLRRLDVLDDQMNRARARNLR